MHEFKSDVVRYCNNFQEGKCKFGEKCKCKHEINPNFKKEDIFINNKNKNNVYNKNNQNKAQVKRTSNSNNYKGNNNYNNISQQRFKVNEGQPPKYSNQNSIPLRNFNNNGDSTNQYSNNNNSVRHSTEYAYTYFWLWQRGHKKISSKYSLYIEL